MLETSPFHSAVWAKQLADKLKIDGHSVKAILAEADIAPSNMNAEGTVLPYAKIAKFFELAADVTGDDCLGFRFGQSRDARDAGLLGYIGLSSPTLIAAVRNLVRYSRVFSDAAYIQADDLEETGILALEFRASPTIDQRQFTEFAITNLVRIFRVMTGRQMAPLEVSFRHPRNSNLRDFDAFFGCKVEFAAARTQIRFKLADLHLEIRTADDRLLQILQENCKEVLDRREAAPASLIEQVERLVVDRLTSDEAKLDTIATELGLSKRTLSRRLADLDTSFNDILDDLRRELALAYLRDSEFSMKEISFLLGYTEVASFSTAFKRWTGATPGKIRKSQTPRTGGASK